MKKIFLVFAAISVLAACSKEIRTAEDFSANDSEDQIVNGSESTTDNAKVYTLSATLPQLKATVNESTGKFEWESTDEIAVYDNEQSKYQVFTTTGSGETVTFSFTATDGLDHDFAGSNAYYPASHLNSAHTAIDTPVQIASAGEVPMSATNTGGSLTFDYDAAIVKLTIENVPSFAVSAEFVNNNNSYAAEISHSVNEDMTFYLVVASSNSLASEINVYDSSNNQIIHKTFNLSGSSSIQNGDLIPLKTKVGPVVDIKNYATSWTAAYIYLFSGENYLGTPWGDLNQVMKSYNDGTYNHYYRVLPSSSLNNTYEVIVFNSSNDTYRIRTNILIENQTNYSASQKEGLRKVGDTHHRVIVRDEALGTNTADNPNTYFYIKSIDGGHEGATGAWESEGTKALGWFIGKRNNNASGRYYYFDTNAISSYSGKSLTFEYTMMNGDSQWRASYNNSGYTYSNYLHLGCYYQDSNLKWYVDSDFDSQMSE